MDNQATDEIALDAYFHRIGYSGQPSADLETLRSLHYCHAVAIAFENLSPLLNHPVLLDLPSLQQKLIHQGRGGYCFEQNALFRSVLNHPGLSGNESGGASALGRARRHHHTPQPHGASGRN
jgi:N-hydroxyarylamine O-acetyltransferase